MKTNEDFSREVIYRPDMKLDENEDFVTVFAITRRENDTNVLVSFFFLVVSVKKHCDYSGDGGRGVEEEEEEEENGHKKITGRYSNKINNETLSTEHR